MAFDPEHLNANERVVLDLRPHWWYFSHQVIAVIVSLVIGVLLLAYGPQNGPVNAVVGILILGSLVWFGLRYLKWTTTNFIITTDRLISRSGIISRQGIEIPLERINTVFFRQSIWERIVGSGDLEVESASEQGSTEFSDIRRPHKVQNEIYKQMEDNENRKFDRVGTNLHAMGIHTQPAPAAPSIQDHIEQLDALRAKGLLTEAEFQEKKAELLRRL